VVYSKKCLKKEQAFLPPGQDWRLPFKGFLPEIRRKK